MCWPWPGWLGSRPPSGPSELVPLCHGLSISSVAVDFEVLDDSVGIEARVETIDRTGVEMEALTACSVAALTIYDMCKSMDRSMAITDIALWEKTGGRLGHVSPRGDVSAT